ncbi:glycosyltransferase family 2 protein [Pontiellaceae bacterium B1224]|nr:glycosyltransferase family 2 protein [Pontiellaceae bacterium B1224]
MENGNSTKTLETFCVLICAFNEEEQIGNVVRSALDQHPNEVIVVDDGSSDATAQIAEECGAVVLKNGTNQGKGASLNRGFKRVHEKQFDAVIVIDGDGQHDPAEISRFLDAYRRTGIPVLIGNRMSDIQDMPLVRRYTNRFMAWVLNRLVKIYVADPPCGYRFYRSDVLPFILSAETRFAFEFDVLVHAAVRRIRIDSVRISTIYNRKRRSHVAPIQDAWLLFGVVKHHFFAARKEAEAALKVSR